MRYNCHVNVTVGKLSKWPISKSSTEWQNFIQSIYISSSSRGYLTGPSLFSIWANDVKYYIGSSIQLFADDRTFLKEIDSPVNYFHKIDNDIETLNSLSKQWRITVKVEKTKFYIYSKKPNKCPHPPRILNNVSIKQVLCHKYLGLIINDTMTWSDHIDDMCKRSNKRLDIILRYLLPRLWIEKLYKSFARSLLDYSDVIYDNCSNVDSTKI